MSQYGNDRLRCATSARSSAERSRRLLRTPAFAPLAACALLVGCSATDRERANADDVSASSSREASGQPAEPDPLATPDTVPDKPTTTPAAGVQEFSRVAFDGTNYLAIWLDTRNGGSVFGATAQIFGTRVSKAGLALDPSGIPIATGPRQVIFPATAFNGVDYLVIWRGVSGIIGTRVSTAGVVLTPSGIPIVTDSATELPVLPNVACGGTDCLVVMGSLNPVTGDTNIRGARVSTAGVLDPSGFDIATGPNIQLRASAAFDGTNYLVAWLEEDVVTAVRSIRGARVTPSGMVLDSPGIVITADTGGVVSLPSVACGEQSCLVTWTDGHGDGGDILGARVSTTGGVLVSPAIPIATGPNFQTGSTAAFDGTRYLVVWEEDGDPNGIFGARVSQAGVVLDPAEITIATVPGGSKTPSVAFGDTSYLVTWNNIDNADLDHVFGTRVNPSGTVLGPKNGRLLSTAGSGHP